MAGAPRLRAARANTVLLPFLRRFRYRGAMPNRSRFWRTALFAGLTAVFLTDAARAADTGNGSKNFRAPSTVPNYFSNEAGPVIGGAAESRRGELYMGQTYAIPRAPQTAAAPAAPTRQRVAMAEPRGRLVRTRGGRLVAHHVTVRGRQVTRVAAHGSTRSHVASHRSTHGTATTTRVSSSHRRARG
jgi:hypothetical protein